MIVWQKICDVEEVLAVAAFGDGFCSHESLWVTEQCFELA